MTNVPISDLSPLVVADTYYAPGGEWIGVVSGRIALLMTPAIDPAGADHLHASLSADPSGPDILTAIAAAHQVGLGDLPEFALVLKSEDDTRVLLRGAVVVTVDGVEHTAVGVGSWAEYRFPRGASVVLAAPAAPPQVERLRLVDGVVRCTCIEVALDSATASRPSGEARVVQTDSDTEFDSGHVVDAAPDGTASGAAGGAYDHLFGPSVQRSVRDAGVWPVSLLAAEQAAEPESTRRPLGDHDGRTLPAASSTSVVSAPPAVVLSTGQRIALSIATIVGRQPHLETEDEVQLVAVVSPNQDISRNHVSLRHDGDTVLVSDLATTNGTRLVRGSRRPVRLEPNEPYAVGPDDVVDLGDGITIRLEVRS